MKSWYIFTNSIHLLQHDTQIMHEFTNIYPWEQGTFLFMFKRKYQASGREYTGCGSITSFFEMRAIQWDDVVAER